MNRVENIAEKFSVQWAHFDLILQIGLIRIRDNISASRKLATIRCRQRMKLRKRREENEIRIPWLLRHSIWLQLFLWFSVSLLSNLMKEKKKNSHVHTRTTLVRDIQHLTACIRLNSMRMKKNVVYVSNYQVQHSNDDNESFTEDIYHEIRHVFHY